MKGNELMFMWNPSWWEIMNDLYNWLSPLFQLITNIEADRVELGKAVEWSFEVIPKLIPNLSQFGKSDVKEACKVSFKSFGLATFPSHHPP